jgi:arylsulfatase A-like enzyme
VIRVYAGRLNRGSDLVVRDSLQQLLGERAPMNAVPAEHGTHRRPMHIPLSPTAAVMLVISIGLCAGYLDLLFMVLLKGCWDEEGYFRTGRDFLWTVPVGHVVLLMIPAALLAVVGRQGRRVLSSRTASWVLATVAIWAALLRLPLYGVATLVLSAGLGRLIGGPVAAWATQPRRRRYALAGLLGVLGLLAAISSGRQWVQEYRALNGLVAPPPGARNVVMIVWDTVRAYNLTSKRYPRPTTPNLQRWAQRGVQFKLAVAPAPWTYPSHSSFLTGQWPYRLNSQHSRFLDSREPTLAEYLASRGYQTAGFSANTNYLSYETGLNRGFIHFEDYPLTPQSFFGRTVPGNWILRRILSQAEFYDLKWFCIRSRDAVEINDAFLDWLRRRRRDRPFFAFLNDFDAHTPYVPSPRSPARFGIQPKAPRDYRLLHDFKDADKYKMRLRDIAMARDCYDDCIAFLDEQLGKLLVELQRQSLFDNTLVIITSDHGEAFGDHGLFGHGDNLYLDQIAVPLVILAPGAPAGRVVEAPASLRDLPATVIDQLGLADGSPIPGHSLAACWSLTTPGEKPPVISPALSEQATAAAFELGKERGSSLRPFQMSLVAEGRHYFRDDNGTEHLYDLNTDLYEEVDLLNSPGGSQLVGLYRRMLLTALTTNPGSIEAEDAYLRTFKRWLNSSVDGSPSPIDPTIARKSR